LTDLIGLRILIAEDNIVNMTLAKILIQKIIPQVSIFEASNGREAVEKFIEVRPHFIFMDVQMPELNGYEASEEIRNIENSKFQVPSSMPRSGPGHSILRMRTSVPIIALTASVLQGERKKCLAAGMDDFLGKPIAKSALEDMLHKWLFMSIEKVSTFFEDEHLK
jgi:CheY-like chemotaxis protein